MTVSGDQQARGSGCRRSAGQVPNIRLRLRFSFRLLSFGYVLNDDLRLTQPIRAAHPFDEILLYICREPSTNQLLFMQNKPNFQDTQMNVSSIITTAYKNFIPLAGQKNKPNSNPIKPNLSQFRCQSNPKQTQFKPKQTQFQTAEKRTKEAKKKKSVSGTFLRLLVAGKIDFLDGCDILLGKNHGKSQFNLFWRLIL